MRINIKKNSNVALYIQIKNQIKGMIYSRQIPMNAVLPSERELAKKLEVNRSTVVRAYQELKAEGLIGSDIGRGTYVIYNNEDVENIKPRNSVKSFFWDEMYSESSKKNYDDIISKIMNIDGNNRIISFAGGIPSPELFPREEFEKIQIELLKSQVENIFSHSPVTGDKLLKKEIKNLMLNRGVRIPTKEVMVTSGSQQGLDLIVRTFINANDVILVEEPTFFGAIQLFESLGAKVVGVPTDEYGIRIDILEYLINKLNPKFIYTIPNFQNPTGVSMCIERRYELIDLSEKYSIPIIEDDPYGELIYDEKQLPSLKALDRHNYVLYLSTFSKVISLGLRVGWIIAPEGVIDKLSMVKQLTDLHVNTLSQHMICEFLRNGYYEKHLKRIRKEYLLKRDIMTNELKRNFEGFKFEKPKGGFYIWGKLPNRVDLNTLFKKSIRNGVDFVPGNFFYKSNEKNDYFIRLNFTYPKKDEIIIGIKRLKDSFNEIKKISND